MSNIKNELLITFVPEESPTKEVAALALAHRLFIPGWALSHDLQSIKKFGAINYWNKNDERLVVALLNETPIGVGLFLPTWSQIFVRKQHHRQRVGTKICEEAKRRGAEPKGITFFDGVLGSKEFDLKMGYLREPLEPLSE